MHIRVRSVYAMAVPKRRDRRNRPCPWKLAGPVSLSSYFLSVTRARAAIKGCGVCQKSPAVWEDWVVFARHVHRRKGQCSKSRRAASILCFFRAPSAALPRNAPRRLIAIQFSGACYQARVPALSEFQLTETSHSSGFFSLRKAAFHGVQKCTFIRKVLFSPALYEPSYDSACAPKLPSHDASRPASGSRSDAFTSLMMSSVCTFRLNRRSAFSSGSPSCTRTSAKNSTSEPAKGPL